MRKNNPKSSPFSPPVRNLHELRPQIQRIQKRDCLVNVKALYYRNIMNFTKSYKPLNWLLTKIIRFYQLAISPWLGNNCKFLPTCSQYATEALNEHNFFKASLLIVWRILRCNPFSKGGYDPVPKKTKK